MGEIFLKVLLIMTVLSAFAVPGFVLKKLKMIGDGGILTLSNILLYVCQPALAIKSFCVFSDEAWEIVNSYDKLLLLKNFGITAGLSVVSLFLMFGLSKLIFIKSKNRKAADVYSFIAVFSNCGFLGVPFVEMFSDGNPLAVMYIMVFNIMFNFFCWTAGVVLITGNFKDIRIKKLVCNPAIISSFVAVILFFVPQINIFMLDSTKELGIFPQYLGYMTAPLSMIIVGIRIAETSVKQLFCKKGVYVSAVLRLIVAPFLTLLITMPFWNMFGGAGGYGEYVYLAPVIAMAMSPAASVVAMAESFGGDKETATAAFVTDTILSLLTIPLVISAVTAICGVAI